MRLNPEEGVVVYTDGSAYYRDRTGGWAYLVKDEFDGLYTKSGSYIDTTSNQMELWAPTRALVDLHKAVGSCKVLVRSDSEYVVLGASDRNRKRNKNKSFWKALDDAIALHEYVSFEHVRGHRDCLENNIVDKMASNERKSIVS